MKILHIGSGNLNSGAGKGLYILHEALLSNGIESKVLCQIEPSNGLKEVFAINKGLLNSFNRFIFTHLDRLPILLYPKRSKELFSNSLLGFDITKHPLYLWADVIHLHWINQGMLSISTIQLINKPIIWTLRDMWFFTGGCHQAFNCEKYITACQQCPHLKSNSKFDLATFNLRRKQNKFDKIHFTAISPWLAELANKSSIFTAMNKKCETIFNIINTDKFSPIIDLNNYMSEILESSKGKKIVLIGATDITSLYKGYHFQNELFDLMGDKVHWIVFGKYSVQNKTLLHYKNYTLVGYINNDELLAQLYSLSDVYVSTSIADSFGKTIVEAQACGTPVVCFDNSGPKHLIKHMETGYLVKSFDINDFKSGILEIIENNFKILNQNKIRKHAESFSKASLIGQYINLYKKALSEKNN
jgi:glycosyltransferase involved in cell wall biosynthesis